MTRLRRWTLAAAALLAVASAAGWFLWRHPDLWVRRALQAAFRPDQVSVGDVRWTSSNTVEVTDLRLGDQASISQGTVTFNAAGLARREIESVTVSNATLRVDLQNTLTNRPAGTATPPGASPRPAWTVRRYDIRNSRLRLENLGPGIPPLDVPVNTTLDDRTERVTAEIRDFAIVSPYDPLARVLHFPRIQFEFTWAGLEARRLDRVTLDSPEIRVGPDLFWYADYAKQQAAAPAPPAAPDGTNAAPAPWSVGRFDVTDGRLLLAPAGQPALRLPFRYEMQQTNLVLGDFDRFNVNAALVIANLTTNYPDYQLALEKLNGRVEFALPRGATNANNLVNTLSLKSVQWRQHRLTNLFLSVTFDERGLYARAGGWVYGGYAVGDLTILNSNRLDWVASVACASFDLGAATRGLSPGQVSATGRGAGRITAAGSGREARDVRGEFRCLTPGTLTIHRVDTLVNKIPADWNQIKRAVVLRLLDTLRHYRFTSGTAAFGWHPPLSRFDLALDGAEGKRNVALKYHHAPDPTP